MKRPYRREREKKTGPYDLPMSSFNVDELLLAVNLTPFDSILYFDENKEPAATFVCFVHSRPELFISESMQPAKLITKNY